MGPWMLAMSMAQAAEVTIPEPVMVAVPALAAGAVGAVGGGFAGLGLGTLACSPDNWECMGPPILGATLGASLGYLGGSVGVGALVSRRRDHSPRSMALVTSGVFLGGAVITGLSLPLGSSVPALVGLSVMALAPAVGGWRATRSATVAPMFDGDQVGIAFGARF